MHKEEAVGKRPDDEFDDRPRRRKRKPTQISPTVWKVAAVAVVLVLSCIMLTAIVYVIEVLFSAAPVLKSQPRRPDPSQMPQRAPPPLPPGRP